MFVYIIAWFPMLLIAILNGAARDFFYKNKLGDLAAHQFSTLTAMLFFSIYVYFVNRIWAFNSSSQALMVGIIWVIMTMIFEFGFGHFIMHHSWEKLLSEYNVLKGKLWGVLLIFLLFIPYIIHYLYNNYKTYE